MVTVAVLQGLIKFHLHFVRILADAEVLSDGAGLPAEP